MARVLKLPSGKRLNVQHMPPPSESGTSPSRPLNLKPSQVVLDGTLLDSVPEAGVPLRDRRSSLAADELQNEQPPPAWSLAAVHGHLIRGKAHYHGTGYGSGHSQNQNSSAANNASSRPVLTPPCVSGVSCAPAVDTEGLDSSLRRQCSLAAGPRSMLPQGAKQPVAGSKQLHTSRAVPWPAAAQVRLLAEGIAVPRLQPFHLRRNPQAQILYCDLERCVSPYLDIELGSHRTESRQSIGPLGPLSPHPLSPSLLKICRPGTASSNPDSDSNPGPFWPSFDDLPEMESLWRAPSMSSGGQHTSRSDDARAPLSPLNLDQLRNSKDSSRDCMTARTFSTASAGTPKSVRSV